MWVAVVSLQVGNIRHSTGPPSGGSNSGEYTIMGKLNYSFDLSETRAGASVRGNIKVHPKSVFLGYVSGKLRISVGDISIVQLYLNNMEIKIFTESGKFYVDFPKESKGSKFHAYSPGDAETRVRITLAILKAVCKSDAERAQMIREHSNQVAA